LNRKKGRKPRKRFFEPEKHLRSGKKPSSYSNSPKFIFESTRRQQNKNLAKSGKVGEFRLLTLFGS
jgi:hypothetical protein